MRRPVPPTNWRTQLADTRDDLRRIREGFAELLDWIDQRSSGGSAITEIQAGTNVTVLNGTGPVVTVSATAGGTGTVSLVTTATPGTVTITNPAGPTVNIDVAAGDVTGVTAGAGIAVAAPTGPVPTVSLGPFATSYAVKTNPAAADRLLIEDSAAALAKKYITVGTIRSATVNPMIDAPGTPDAYNDEFDSGSSDPLARGWSLWNVTAGVAYTTRLGDVDPYSDLTAGTANNAFRSTRNGSFLFIQIKPSQNMLMTKAHPGDGSYAVRAQCNKDNTEGGVLMWISSTSASAGGGSQSFLGVYNNGGATWRYTKIAAATGSTDTAAFTAGAINGPDADTILMDWSVAGNSFKDSCFDAGNLRSVYKFANRSTHASNFSGLYIKTGTSGANNVQIFAIDYVRRYPVGSYFPLA